MTGDPRLSVSHAPFWRVGQSVTSRSLNALLALSPAAVMGVVRFGGRAVGVMGLSVALCMAFELAANRLTRRPSTLHDGTAALSGLILALLMPVSAPWWAVAVGAFVAMIIGKHIFGGLGGNPFNPVLVALAILTISWPSHFTFDAALAPYDFPFPGVDPLAALKHFGTAGIARFNEWDLFLGRQAGGIGAVSGAALLAGGVYLMLRGIVRWEISLSFLLGVAVTARVFYLFGNPALNAGPVFHILTGYTMMGAFFLAAEESGSPVNFLPMLLFGFFAGFLTILIRSIGFHDDGVVYAILLMNVVQPLLDKIRPGALGRIGDHA